MNTRSPFGDEHSPELSLVLRLATAQAEALGEHRYVTRSGSSFRISGDPPSGTESCVVCQPEREPPVADARPPE